jgi:hypothetical protein
VEAVLLMDPPDVVLGVVGSFKVSKLMVLVEMHKVNMYACRQIYKGWHMG